MQQNHKTTDHRHKDKHQAKMPSATKPPSQQKTYGKKLAGKVSLRDVHCFSDSLESRADSQDICFCLSPPLLSSYSAFATAPFQFRSTLPIPVTSPALSPSNQCSGFCALALPVCLSGEGLPLILVCQRHLLFCAAGGSNGTVRSEAPNYEGK